MKLTSGIELVVAASTLKSERPFASCEVSALDVPRRRRASPAWCATPARQKFPKSNSDMQTHHSARPPVRLDWLRIYWSYLGSVRIFKSRFCKGKKNKRSTGQIIARHAFCVM